MLKKKKKKAMTRTLSNDPKVDWFPVTSRPEVFYFPKMFLNFFL